MKNKIVIVAILFSALSSKGQLASIETPVVSYSKMLISNEHLLTITDKGQLCVWDLNTLEKMYETSDTTLHLTAIQKDNNEDVFVGNHYGKIYKMAQNDFKLEIIMTLRKKASVSEMFFNSSNKLFVILPYAVYDQIEKK